MIKVRRELVGGGSVVELQPETEKDERDLTRLHEAGLIDDGDPQIPEEEKE